MSTQAPAYPLRLDATIARKAKYIAKENGRSLNKEIEAVLKKTIKSYEDANGPILLSDE